MTEQTPNKDLLERAAKAYGLDKEYVYVCNPFYEGMERRNFEENGFELATQTWNPLTDHADLYHMARKLKITISFKLECAFCGTIQVSWPDEAKDDVYAAVTAAAKMGDLM